MSSAKPDSAAISEWIRRGPRSDAASLAMVMLGLLAKFRLETAVIVIPREQNAGSSSGLRHRHCTSARSEHPTPRAPAPPPPFPRDSPSPPALHLCDAG